MDNNITDYNKLLFDPKFRKEIRNNPNECATLLGFGESNKEDIKYVVKTNTKEVLYMVILEAAHLNKDILDLQAAGTTGSASTAGTASTVGTAITCMSTLSSIASVGTAGSANV